MLTVIKPVGWTISALPVKLISFSWPFYPFGGRGGGCWSRSQLHTWKTSGEISRWQLFNHSEQKRCFCWVSSASWFLGDVTCYSFSSRRRRSCICLVQANGDRLFSSAHSLLYVEGCRCTIIPHHDEFFYNNKCFHALQGRHSLTFHPTRYWVFTTFHLFSFNCIFVIRLTEILQTTEDRFKPSDFYEEET